MQNKESECDIVDKDSIYIVAAQIDASHQCLIRASN